MAKNKEIVKLNKLSLVIGSDVRDFEPCEALVAGDDVCSICLADGLGQYCFNEQTDQCSFIDTCESVLLGNSDLVYLKEVSRGTDS